MTFDFTSLIGPAIGAAASIGGGLLSNSSQNNSASNALNASLLARQNSQNMAWNLINGSNMSTKPWNTTSYPDLSQGWWNTTANPTQTTIPDYQKYNFQQYGTAAPTYQTYSGANPTYTGLSGGDYTKLQASLETPGKIAAQQAFQQGKTSLNSATGAKGTYGSSTYTGQMNNGLTSQLINSLATNAANAATQRYGMEQTDLGRKLQADTATFQGRMAENQAANSQAYNAWNAGLNQNNLMNQLNYSQNASANNYGMQQAIQQNTLDNQQFNWNLQKAQGAWNGLLGQTNWNNSQNQQAYQNILGLSKMYDNSDIYMQGAQSQGNQNSGNTWGNMLGTIGGNILGGTNWGSMFGSGNSWTPQMPSASSYTPSSLRAIYSSYGISP
ncbi:hypothetical protein JCM15519_04550 [Fundidesulfovibrio butyratiphilus]